MTQLKSFIAHARSKGMDHQTIRVILLSAGWKERDIAEALTEESLDMPVPMPPDAGGARDAFFHLLTFVSLYTTVISLIILFFTYINRLFPDPATQGQYYNSDGDFSSIRWSIAAIIVAFPLFLWLSRLLLKEMEKHVEKAASGIRRWLTYLTLFVTAAALMGDVITLIFYLLNGELSVRFLCKVFVILVLAGMTFTYYFLALRTDPMTARKSGLHKIFGWSTGAVALIAIVWGFLIIGSPATQREKQFDDRRLEDLRTINNEVINIVQPVKRTPDSTKPPSLTYPLPKTLQEVSERARYQKIAMNDPETGLPYEYRVTGTSSFDLCATFHGVRDMSYDILWNHPAGHYCYHIDVLEVD